MFENILGAPKERRTQLLFRDDGAFQFRKMDIEKTFLIEKKQDIVVRGWVLSHRNQYPFDGYGSIKADQVTISHNRDILYDPYKLVEQKDKPEILAPPTVANKIKGNGAGQLTGVQIWLAQVGEDAREQILSKRDKKSNLDKMTTWLSVAMIIEIVALILGGLANRGS